MERFPRLYSPRLCLRKLQVEDFPSLVQHANNKKISDNIINIPNPYREPDAAFRMSYVHQGFVKKARYVFAITFKESDEFVGEISLHLNSNKPIAELGYWVGEDFWNRGIATEAIAEILNFGFAILKLEHIFATCHIDNPASSKLLVKNGLEAVPTKGNVLQYQISKATHHTQ